MRDDRPTRCRCGSPLQPPPGPYRFRCPGCGAIYDAFWDTMGTSKAALPETWRDQAWKGPVHTVAVDWRYGPEELERIRWGLVPREMEEKWYIIADGDDLRFHRSWTANLCYVARLAPAGVSSVTLLDDLRTMQGGVEFVKGMIDLFLVGDSSRPR